MIEKPKRPKKIPNQDNKQPQTIQELIRRYDLDNTKIYDFLDEFVDSLNKKDTYSTAEQKVGTWLDGKTIYKRTYIVNTPANTNTDTAIIELPTDILSYVKVYGQVYLSDIHCIVPVPYFFSTENNGMIWIDTWNKKVLMKVNLEAYTNQELIFTIEYTKKN